MIEIARRVVCGTGPLTQIRPREFHRPKKNMHMRMHYLIIGCLFSMLVLGSSTPAWTQSIVVPFEQHLDSNLSGSYSGDIFMASGARSRVIVHIVAYVNGPCDATWDAPNFGWIGNRFSTVSCVDGKILLQSDSADVAVEATHDPIKQQLTGTWVQRRTNSPVVLKKLYEAPRVQEPGDTPPYIAESFRVPNRPAGILVGGELTFPDTLGRYPLVILAGDRGQADRVARGKHGHAPYLVLASMFAQRNIATVRIDDRGTGQTTGAANDQSVDDEASDISAVLDALWKHPRVDTTRIVIIGHGEGGLAAAMVARRYPNRVTRIAMLATPMLSGKETLVEQMKARELSRGTDAELVDVATGLVAAWCDLLLSSPTMNDQALVPLLLSIADSVLMNRPDVAMRYPMVRQLQRPGRELYMQSTLMPWLRSYLWYSPADYVALQGPTLALFAERDIEVPGALHATAFRALGQRRTSRSTWTSAVFPNTNHQFQECDDCTEEEMARTSETIRPDVVARLAVWVLRGE